MQSRPEVVAVAVAAMTATAVLAAMMLMMMMMKMMTAAVVAVLRTQNVDSVRGQASTVPFSMLSTSDNYNLRCAPGGTVCGCVFLTVSVGGGGGGETHLSFCECHWHVQEHAVTVVQIVCYGSAPMDYSIDSISAGSREYRTFWGFRDPMRIGELRPIR